MCNNESSNPIDASNTSNPDADYLKSLVSISSVFISGVLTFGAVAGFLISSLTAENIKPDVESIIALCIRASLAFFGSFIMAAVAVAMLETSVVFSKYENNFANRWSGRISFGFSVIAILIAFFLFLYATYLVFPLWHKVGGLI